MKTIQKFLCSYLLIYYDVSRNINVGVIFLDLLAIVPWQKQNYKHLFNTFRVATITKESFSYKDLLKFWLNLVLCKFLCKHLLGWLYRIRDKGSVQYLLLLRHLYQARFCQILKDVHHPFILLMWPTLIIFFFFPYQISQKSFYCDYLVVCV